MNSPDAVAVLKAMTSRRQMPKRGFWIELKVIDDNDDELELECLVDVEEERDPYGTGDSPTMYDVEIIKCISNGEDIDCDDYEEQINEAAIKEYLG